MPGAKKPPKWIDRVDRSVWLTAITVFWIAALAITVALLDYAELSFFLPIWSP